MAPPSPDLSEEPVPFISAAESKAQQDGGSAIIVDVRQPVEIAVTGKVAGALTIPLGLLLSKADPASPDHDPRIDPARTTILYCASGTRSAHAGRLLRHFGFKDVRNMGGFNDWDQENFPIEPAEG